MKTLKTNWLSFLLGILAVAVVIAAFIGLKLYIDEISSQPTDYSVTVSYSNPINFTYDLEDAVVDVKGTRLKAFESSVEVTGLSDIALPVGGELSGFVENAEIGEGSSIKYQLTTDYVNWYYYNGESWVLAGDCEDCYNSVAEVDGHISELPLESGSLRVRVLLESGKTTVPTLHSIEVKFKGKSMQLTGEEEDIRALFYLEAADEECGPCEGKVTYLQLQYDGGTAAQVRIVQVNGGDVIFDAEVQPNEIIAFDGTWDVNNSMGPEIEIFVDDVSNANVHTSCSVELTPGDVYGNFTIIAGTSSGGGAFCDGGSLPPVAENDFGTTPTGVPTMIDLLANDYDVDGIIIPSTTSVVSSASHGTTSINSTTGAAIYTPTAGYVGSDTFIYEVCDNDGLCDTAVATITITGGQCVVAYDDYDSTPKNTPVDIDILDNDYDPNGVVDPSSASVTSNPSNGTVSVDPVTGLATYTPATDFVGTDTFTYEICGGEGGTGNTQVNTCQASKTPICHATGSVSNPYTFLCVNASSIDGVGANDHTQHPGDIIPIGDVDGDGDTDVDDCNAAGGPCCDTAVVTVDVTALPPVAQDDSAVTEENTPVDIDLLDNDYDPDGSLVPSTTVVTSNPSHGSVTINPANGVATYTPNTGFSGTDSFVYEVCDNDGLCDTATVIIGIDANAPPIANDDYETTEENTPVVIDILFNDEDIDGYLVPSTVAILIGPSNGSVAINTTNGEVTYTPDYQFTGTDTFVYQVCDNDGACDDALVTIDIVSNFPPVANDDYEITNFETPVIVDLLDNDFDTDGVLDPATTTVLTSPSNGGVTINPADGAATYTPAVGFYGTDTFTYEVCDEDGACDDALVTIDVNGPPTANDDSETTLSETPVLIDVLANDTDPEDNIDPTSVTVTSFPTDGFVTVNPITGINTYLPDPGFYGVDTYVYQVCDTQGLCDTATVTITVLARPIAEDDSETTDENEPVDIDLLDNDSDPDGVLIPSTTTVLSGPANGGVTINPANGVATYTPDYQFNGVDSFVYEVCDNDGLCDTATATITIVPNTPPVAEDDSESTDAGVPVDVDLLDNDHDTDGVLVPSTTAVLSGPANGGATVNPVDGVATYTPDAGFYGIDIFYYEAV